MRNNILQRPMFRRNGSPSTGERVSNLQTLLQDIRDTENLRSTVGNAESDNIQRQLGNLLKVPFEEFQGKYVRNPKTGEFEPMSGPLTGTVVRESEMTMDPNVEMVTVIDRREGSETFGMPISVPRNMDTYEMIRSGEFQFDEIPGMAEGGEMQSDAVGIADGLDQETPKADPNTTGVAKVSPEQYVELMNQVRGDEVPLEGRVQELAMTVGEKDAQDTPLSVLALVQPVFELQEQQGIGATEQAQAMPPMASDQLMSPQSEGIVRAQKGLFADLAELVGPEKAGVLESFGKYYGVGEPFDLDATKQMYLNQLMNKEKMRDQAYLDAAPLLLQIGAKALDPTTTTPELITTGAASLAKFGTDVGKKISEKEKTALTLALKEKQTKEEKEGKFGEIIGKNLIDIALKDPTKEAGEILDNQIKEANLAIKEIEKGFASDNAYYDLENKKINFLKNRDMYDNLSTELQNKNELAILQIEGTQLDNQLKQFDVEKRPIVDALEIESKQITNLTNQLELDAKPDMLKEQLSKIKGENQKLYKELDMMDEVASQAFWKNELEIAKLEKELNSPSKSPDELKELRSLREEFNKNISVKNINSKNNFYGQIRNAIALSPQEIEEQITKLVPGTEDEKLIEYARGNPNGAKDLIIMFNFMKMLDPDSVVREGEQLLLEKTNPVTERFATLIDTINGGGFLGEKQKNFLLQETKILMDTAVNDYVDQRDKYIAIGKDNLGDKFDPSIQLPGPNLDLYKFDVENDVIGKLLRGEQIDTTVIIDGKEVDYGYLLERF